MNILGVNCFSHDTSAALLTDGEIIAFAEEERFNRDKHTKAFPFTAIEYCLKEGGIEADEIDYVAFPFKPWLDFKRGFKDFRRHPSSYKRFGGQAFFDYKLSRKANIFKKHFDYKGKIIFVGHHQAHAASSYFVSPFKEAAILSIDRGGDYISTMMAKAQSNEINEIKHIYNPHSLGSVYSCITNFLGFKPNGGEGKVMGLAPYGNDCLCEQFDEIVKPKHGYFNVDLSYFKYHRRGGYEVSKKFKKLFGDPREPESEMTAHYQNIAFAVQQLTEERAVDLAKWLWEETKKPNLCIAGGLGLNSVMNQKIIDNTPFERIFIQPSANDGGISLGAALYVWHVMFKNYKRHAIDMVFNPYLGPKYSNLQIKKVLDDRHLKYRQVRDPAKTAARLLAKNKLIGWFQGRMEAGPRALGNRSILANTCNKETKDILNKRVKFRESFRPFAPSVKEEAGDEYFKNYQPTPYMLLVQEIYDYKQNEIPAVTHVDGTGRLQTVSKELNPLYWKLIDEFEKLTGVPVVLNTSFNIRGEPIVCNPKDAVNCFAGTGLDALIIGDYLVEK